MTEFEKIREEYESLGWLFKCEEWSNHHNGNDEYSWSFNSPRMSEFKQTYAIMGECGRYFDKERLLREEANHAYSSSMHNSIVRKISNEVSRYMNDKFLKLYINEESPLIDSINYEEILDEAIEHIKKNKLEEFRKPEPVRELGDSDWFL